jgi:flagellar biosynthesis GTPase FlhF
LHHYSSVGDLLRDREQQAKEKLDEQYHQRMIAVVTPDMEKVKVPSAAGNCCDHCQKTKQEIGTKVLLCCSRCKFEYYCSKDCQAAAWKTKHRKHCRAPGDFRPGDQALDGRNGTQILLIHPTTPPTSEAWLVSNKRKEKKHTVPTTKLQRLRPKLWLVVMTRKEAEDNLKDSEQTLKVLKEQSAEMEESEKELKKKKEELEKKKEELEEKMEAAERNLRELQSAQRNLQSAQRNLQQLSPEDLSLNMDIWRIEL